MASPQRAPLFDLGRVVATPGAMAILLSAGENPARLLERHASGDCLRRLGRGPARRRPRERAESQARLALDELLSGG
jgi:hypothetical protein